MGAFILSDLMHELVNGFDSKVWSKIFNFLRSILIHLNLDKLASTKTGGRHMPCKRNQLSYVAVSMNALCGKWVDTL